MANKTANHPLSGQTRMDREQAGKLWVFITEKLAEMGLLESYAVIISDVDPTGKRGDCDIQVVPNASSDDKN